MSDIFKTGNGEVEIGRDERQVLLRISGASDSASVNVSSETANRIAAALVKASGDGTGDGTEQVEERTVWYSPATGAGYVVLEGEDAADGRYRILRLVDQDGTPAQGSVHTRPDGALAMIEFGADEDSPEIIPFLPPPGWETDSGAP